jgi:adenylate cyclase
MQQRRLAAVMFTDIVGYTAMMGRNEDLAFETLRINREIHQTSIDAYEGTLIKEIGDGILASFPSASNAVRCALGIMETALANNITLRIGIHEGEMVFEGADVLGDGVNIASRLQSLAEEGSIIISGTVYQEIKNKEYIHSEFIGDRILKNVEEPVKIYRVTRLKDKIPQTGSPVLASPIKSWYRRTKHIFIAFILLFVIGIITWYVIFNTPFHKNETPVERSIAVLPFENISNDKDQEYMCDGLTEEIIYNLSQIHSFDKVISRTSVMKFRHADKTIKEIAEILGVNTILEGSYRQSGDRIRITVQLIDAKTDGHLWSKIYEKPMGDIFIIQSDIARNIASTLQAELTESENNQFNKIPTKDIDAYRQLQKAQFIFYQTGNTEKSIDMINQLLADHENYAEAIASLSEYHLYSGIYAGNREPADAMKAAKIYAEKALEIDRNLSLPHYVLSMIHMWWEWDFKSALDEIKEGLSLNPNDVKALLMYSNYLVQLGQFDRSLVYSKKAVELNPLFSFSYGPLINSYTYLKDFSKATEIINEGVSVFENDFYEIAWLYYLHLDSADKAIFYLQKYHEWWVKNNPEDYPLWLAGMAIAYQKKGDTINSDKYLKQLTEREKVTTKGSPDYNLALYYASKGLKEETFYWLESAYKNRSMEMPWIKVEPLFQFIRNDPRYLELYEKVGFRKFDDSLKAGEIKF